MIFTFLPEVLVKLSMPIVINDFNKFHMINDDYFHCNSTTLLYFLSLNYLNYPIMVNNYSDIRNEWINDNCCSIVVKSSNNNLWSWMSPWFHHPFISLLVAVVVMMMFTLKFVWLLLVMFERQSWFFLIFFPVMLLMNCKLNFFV